MTEKDIIDARSYDTNLFSWPKNYFRDHTAEELEVSEEVRQYLIDKHDEYYRDPPESDEEYDKIEAEARKVLEEGRKKEEEEFLKLFESEE